VARGGRDTGVDADGCVGAMLKRNVLANFAGGIWTACLTLLVTPIQIHLLGIEAYGVIGFIATLQIVVGVLDLGLSSTLTREIAADHSAGWGGSQTLLRTATSVYWSFAALIGVGLYLSSGALARRWFNPGTFDLTTLTQAVEAAAIYLALRWPIALYTGVLAGTQRMDVLNVIKVASVSARLLGGIVVLLIWRDLIAFLAWTVVSAMLEVVLYVFTAHRVMPSLRWRPGFSVAAVRAVAGFSSQLGLISILGVGLSQVDRLMISKMLPLDQLGYYSLAYTAATAISLVISSLSAALMPSFAASHGAGARDALIARYRSANEIMLYVTGLVLFSLAFFGRPLLSLWVSAPAAAQAWLPLAMLACGFWLSAAVSNPYTLCIASRKAHGPLIITIVTGTFYVPLMYWAILRWGIVGAAFAWVVLNVSYVATYIPYVHRSLVRIPVWPWFSRLLFPFAALGVATFGAARLLLFVAAPAAGAWAAVVALALAAATYTAVGYLLLDPSVRRMLRQMLEGEIRLVGGDPANRVS